MKKLLLLILSLTILVNYSCNKDEDDLIETDVEIRFLSGSGDGVVCGEFCGTRIKLPDNISYKAKNELPDSIKNKSEYWNRTYIATIKYLDKNCTCKDGNVDPIPNGEFQFPTRNYPIIEIISIREK
jgi:hypothetical protein